jgi:hypothetical protein
MIVKKAKGWYVQSEKGRNLGGPYPTYDAAQKRLDQVEFYADKAPAQQPALTRRKPRR